MLMPQTLKMKGSWSQDQGSGDLQQKRRHVEVFTAGNHDQIESLI